MSYTVYKTAPFKIHNPSKRKCAVLDDALKRHHISYSRVLAKALASVEDYAAIENKNERKKQIKVDVQKLVYGDKAQGIKGWDGLSNAAKAAVHEDVYEAIESYIQIRKKQDNTSLPSTKTLKLSQTRYQSSLEALETCGLLDEENALRDTLACEADAGKLRPQSFYKFKKNDGFLIVRDPDTDKYAIYLNLHPKNSRFASPVQVHGVNIRTSEEISFKSKTGAIFPVAFGQDYQMQAFLASGTPKSARLIKKGEGHYEVHVTFEYDVEPIEPSTYLGVDRGIYNLASLAVTDREGRYLNHEHVDGMRLRYRQRIEEQKQRDRQQKGRKYTRKSRKAMADEAVHHTANRIVDMACQHNAQVVLEDLSNLTHRGGKRGKSGFNRLLTRSQYGKLRDILSYKLPLKGLPKPVNVAPHGTSQTCPECGEWDKENRQKTPNGSGFVMDRFLCVSCGYEDDADLNAARVIALKKQWRDDLPNKHRKELAKDIPAQHGFNQYLSTMAAQR